MFTTVAKVEERLGQLRTTRLIAKMVVILIISIFFPAILMAKFAFGNAAVVF